MAFNKKWDQLTLDAKGDWYTSPCIDIEQRGKDEDWGTSSGIDIGGQREKVPTLPEVCDWIVNNFQRLLNGQTPMTKLLPMLHRALQLETGAPTTTDAYDLGTRMVALISKYCAQDKALTIVLQLIYQILNTLKPEQTYTMHFAEQVLAVLVPLCVSGTGTAQSNSQRQILANKLICVQLCVQKCKTPPAKAINKLWLLIGIQLRKTPPTDAIKTPWSMPSETLAAAPPHIVQILIQLFDEFVLCVPDDFHRSAELIAITQQLLASGEREDRKKGCYLSKKVLSAVSDPSSDDWDATWSIYSTVMENLEENQSHLILPSLEALKSINQPKHDNDFWQSWKDVVYMRVLAHNNTLVIRWAVEYFLATFKWTELSPSVLLQLLQALNTTSLYNSEGSGYFLPHSNIETFLAFESSSFVPFWELFAGVSWKSVPLHFWLAQLQKSMNGKQFHCACSKELLLQLAARVRVLQNPKIRQRTIRVFKQIFAESIESLALAEYVQLIETLYNVMDFYWTSEAENWHIFLKKLQQNGNRPIADDTFSKRFYDILTNYIDFDLVDVIHAEIPAVLQYLEALPKSAHGWLRFLVVFYAKHTEEMQKFCLTKYEIDFGSLKILKLDEMISHFQRKLCWCNTEFTFVREGTMDFFVKLRSNDFKTSLKCDLDIEGIICSDMGTKRTFHLLSMLLLESRHLWDAQFLNYFLRELKKISKTDIFCSKIVENILALAIRSHEQVEDLLDVDFENIGWCICKTDFNMSLSTDCYIRGILLGEAKTGDARIEECYEHHILLNNFKILQMRRWFINGARKTDAKIVVDELLEINHELSRKRPRYFENSKEHRLKLRIATAISYLTDNVAVMCVDDLWNIFLEQNNQPNVTYLFEILIVRYVKMKAIMEQLGKVSQLTASQQVSVICVTHAYCVVNLMKYGKKVNQCEQPLPLVQIINALLPLTMGANFQTRTYSQLAIFSILESCLRNSFDIPQSMDQFKTAIEAAVGDQLTGLLADVRLQWPFLKQDRLADQIMYITDAPFDEYDRAALTGCDIIKLKHQFAKKHDSSSAKHIAAPAVNAINNDIGKIQRKMNPVKDIVLQNNLITYPFDNNNEIYVVASLVDKLPNLGGIARTCEVLGINNLVMDSKSHVEKNDFKNLSMTAEKGLNIVEIKPAALSDFLVQKQTEGFQIVGAEQTANSKNFVGFEFPKKCVLLLGHEKEGIPANLLGFLDYAVEIPQFGMVRSLNVHVTGALFMWEYCKQHIIDN